jgi:hypothetical protein
MAPRWLAMKHLLSAGGAASEASKIGYNGTEKYMKYLGVN